MAASTRSDFDDPRFFPVTRQRGDRMKRWGSITALGAAAVLMAMIGVYAWVQWGKADRADSSSQREGKAGDMNLQRRLLNPTLVDAAFARMQRNVSRFLTDLARQHEMRG